MTENALAGARSISEVKASVEEATGHQVATQGMTDANLMMEVLAGQLLLVELHIGQWGAKSRWTPSEWGIEGFEEIRDPDLRGAVSEIYGYGERALLPPHVVKALTNVANRGRKLLYRSSVETPMGYAMSTHTYESFRGEIAALRDEYMALVDDVCDNLDGYLEEISETYRVQAAIAYRRAFGMDINDQTAIPPAGFVQDFIDDIIRNVPHPDDIRRRFNWEVKVTMPILPSMVEAENQRIEELRQAGYHKRTLDEQDLDAELRRRRAIQDELESQALQQARDLVKDVVRQINSHVFDVVTQVQNSIKTNDGKLVGRSALAVKNLLAWAEANNPTTNEDLVKALTDLESKFGMDATDRDVTEISGALRGLETITRQKLLDLASFDERQVREIQKETKAKLSIDRTDLRRHRRMIRGKTEDEIILDGLVPEGRQIRISAVEDEK